MHSAFRWQRRQWLRRSILLALAALLTGALGASIAHAAGGTAVFGLQPVFYDPTIPITRSYFIFAAHPGEVIHSEVRVSNTGTVVGTVSLYGVDATTGQTSGTVFRARQDPQTDVGAWLALGVPQVTLAPGQSQIVPFQIAIPPQVRPGQHVGGIVAQDMAIQRGPNKGALQINIQHLTIVAVQINLPGAIVDQLEVTGIEPGGAIGYQTLLVGLRNSGTTMLKPFGTLQVTDAHGHLLQNLALKLDTFLPQTTIDYPVFLQGHALSAGQYQATLTLTYGHHHMLFYRAAFTIAPAQIAQVFHQRPPLVPPPLNWPGNLLWPIVGGVLFLLALLLGGVRYRRTRFTVPKRRVR
jgi:hypothetical protein